MILMKKLNCISAWIVLEFYDPYVALLENSSNSEIIIEFLSKVLFLIQSSPKLSCKNISCRWYDFACKVWVNLIIHPSKSCVVAACRQHMNQITDVKMKPFSKQNNGIVQKNMMSWFLIHYICIKKIRLWNILKERS